MANAIIKKYGSNHLSKEIGCERPRIKWCIEEKMKINIEMAIMKSEMKAEKYENGVIL